MDLAGLPQFAVETVRQAEDGFVLTGRLSHLQGVRNHQGWLYRSDRPSIVGTLSRVPAHPAESVEFQSPDDELVAGLAAGETYPWIDGYWQAYQVAMVLAGRWELRTFAAEGAHYFRQAGVLGWQPAGRTLPEGAEDLGVRAGGWDHEHCELCGAHVGGPGDAQGYVDPENHWLCRPCYERYAVGRDVSFVAKA